MNAKDGMKFCQKLNSYMFTICGVLIWTLRDFRYYDKVSPCPQSLQLRLWFSAEFRTNSCIKRQTLRPILKLYNHGIKYLTLSTILNQNSFYSNTLFSDRVQPNHAILPHITINQDSSLNYDNSWQWHQVQKCTKLFQDLSGPKKTRKSIRTILTGD